MNLEEFIASEIPESTPSTRYYEKTLREAFEKYHSLDSADLRFHLRRINQEIILFGDSFRTTAAIKIIKTILLERNYQ